jgi:penicillin-binding protein 1C
LVHTSQDGQWQVNSSCESVDRIVTIPWFVLSPAQEYYYRSYNPDYRPLPPVKPGCTPPGRAIEIIYPNHNDVLFQPKGFSGAREKLVFRAAHADPAATIYWYIDETYLGTTQTTHTMALDTSSGRHLLSLTDDRGNSRRIVFTVK